MPAAYSRDLCDRLLRAHDAGLSDAEIAGTLGVSPRTLTCYRTLRRQGQSLHPQPKPGRRRRPTPEQETLLVTQVHATPDATLAEHRDRLAHDHGLTISRATLCRVLQRHRRTVKKSS